MTISGNRGDPTATPSSNRRAVGDLVFGICLLVLAASRLEFVPAWLAWPALALGLIELVRSLRSDEPARPRLHQQALIASIVCGLILTVLAGQRELVPEGNSSLFLVPPALVAIAIGLSGLWAGRTAEAPQPAENDNPPGRQGPRHRGRSPAKRLNGRRSKEGNGT